MEITNDSLPWSTEDIDVLRTFLKSQTGSRLLPKILESTPSLLAKGDINEILVRSGEVRGFQLAARAFLEMLVYPPLEKPVTIDSHLPNLEDDRAWNDGQKFSETPTTI